MIFIITSRHIHIIHRIDGTTSKLARSCFPTCYKSPSNKLEGLKKITTRIALSPLKTNAFNRNHQCLFIESTLQKERSPQTKGLLLRRTWPRFIRLADYLHFTLMFSSLTFPKVCTMLKRWTREKVLYWYIVYAPDSFYVGGEQRSLVRVVSQHLAR